MPSPLNRGLLLFWRKLMSEDLPVNRMSFRADKQTELLNLKKNLINGFTHPLNW